METFRAVVWRILTFTSTGLGGVDSSTTRGFDSSAAGGFDSFAVGALDADREPPTAPATLGLPLVWGLIASTSLSGYRAD